MSDESVALHLSTDEALVLLELLARYEQTERLTTEHGGEEAALWRLHAALEKALTTPLRPDYRELVASARERLAEQAGT